MILSDLFLIMVDALNLATSTFSSGSNKFIDIICAEDVVDQFFILNTQCKIIKKLINKQLVHQLTYLNGMYGR